jgi:hypothetical protein
MNDAENKRGHQFKRMDPIIDRYTTPLKEKAQSRGEGQSQQAEQVAVPVDSNSTREWE